jgi:hypothetical protein
MKKIELGLMAALLVSVVPAGADVWDMQTNHDNLRTTTYNELLHGDEQAHDLGALPGPAPDEDWFRIPQSPRASYEVLVDGVSGDIKLDDPGVTRVSATGAVLQGSSPAVLGTSGYTRTLRWMNVNTAVATQEFVRVGSAACTTDCRADDQYTIRFRQTTINVARFNQSGSQSTVLLTQNVSDRTAFARYYFWDASGALIVETLSVPIPPKMLIVTSLGALPPLVGRSGHITIAHDAGYGGLNVKAVAVEMETGFTFDTPGTYVVH